MNDSELVNFDERGRWRMIRVPPDHTTATTARMLLDEHRSNGGTCVRCNTPWPCAIASEAMYGTTP